VSLSNVDEYSSDASSETVSAPPVLELAAASPSKLMCCDDDGSCSAMSDAVAVRDVPVAVRDVAVPVAERDDSRPVPSGSGGGSVDTAPRKPAVRTAARSSMSGAAATVLVPDAARPKTEPPMVDVDASASVVEDGGRGGDVNGGDTDTPLIMDSMPSPLDISASRSCTPHAYATATAAGRASASHQSSCR
jgi:hypothetical protein